MAVGIGITTNQFVNPIALKAIGWKLVSNSDSGTLDCSNAVIVHCLLLLAGL